MIMRAMKRARRIVMMCGWLAAAAVPAAAQSGPTPKAELAGGYQWLHGKSETLKKGWFADVAINANREVGLDLQVDGSYNNISESMSGGGLNLSLDANHHVYHAMAGVRLNNRKTKQRRRSRMCWPACSGRARAGRPRRPAALPRRRAGATRCRTSRSKPAAASTSG
jgi:hypothetical protein